MWVLDVRSKADPIHNYIHNSLSVCKCHVRCSFFGMFVLSSKQVDRTDSSRLYCEHI